MSDSKTRDYFAEMYVAGVMADAGWNLYFPHRDIGFDMIATKIVGATTIIRPVQVKGKYASDEKTDKKTYGYSGRLTAIHDDMVLAIPYFVSSSTHHPKFVAWLPWKAVKLTVKGHRCHPARFVNGLPEKRLEYEKYFGELGLMALSDDLV